LYSVLSAFRCGNATVTVGIDSSEVVTTQAGLVKSVLGASLYDGCLEGVDEAGKECTKSRTELSSDLSE